jgi:hypothetical protein
MINNRKTFIFFSEIVGELTKKNLYLPAHIENSRIKLIAMSSDLETSIRQIEETNDPENAYFSYSVDDSGEFGVIKANKEGLRLYAADLLKRLDVQRNRIQPDRRYSSPI